MNRIVKSDDLNGPLPDPRSDANWQARLEEARAKRAIALAERAKTAGPKKKRLKPWEEEGAVVLDEDDDEIVTPQSGLGFSERVEAMRAHERVKAASSKTGSDGNVAPSNRNWSEDALNEPLERVEPPKAEPMSDEPLPERTAVLSPAGTVNDLFDSPAFASDTPSHHVPANPVSLLRSPPPIEPSPVPPWRQAAIEEAQVAPVSVPAPAAVRAPKASRKVSVGALMLVAAISVGPIWQMTRPVERGPLVFTLSAFALEPALGLTSPMFEAPRPTRPGEWTPATDAPPRGPYDVGRPVVPAKVARPADFEADPVFGPIEASIAIGVPPLSSAPRVRTLVDALTVPVIDPVPGRFGVAGDVGSAIKATPGPVERPDRARNG